MCIMWLFMPNDFKEADIKPSVGEKHFVRFFFILVPFLEEINKEKETKTKLFCLNFFPCKILSIYIRAGNVVIFPLCNVHNKLTKVLIYCGHDILFIYYN